MGLSVGVVRIEYLDDPISPVSDFLAALAMNPSAGLNEDDDDPSWADGGLFECESDDLMYRAVKLSIGATPTKSNRAGEPY